MKRVSSWSMAVAVVLLVVLSANKVAASANFSAEKKQLAKDPQQLFAEGEAALRNGKLDEAARDFRKVLEIKPAVAGAYANLGVIEMRRKHWPQALDMLHRAAELAPDLTGLQLNIGLVYYRQKDFRDAIPPFEAVVERMPSSFQARYLLGFCYFFDGRWKDSVATLEPLWDLVPQADQLNYLYVLGRSAEVGKDSALEEKAYARMAEIGQQTPEYRMIVGKSHLNRGEYDAAIEELDAAARAQPKLPLVHYYLGVTYFRKQEYVSARAEFEKDIAIEPDAAYTYEQLGKVESMQQDDVAAARDFGRAVRLDPGMLESRMGLAEIAQGKKQYSAALVQLNEIIRLDPSAASARYLRGQVLVRMGREKEGRAELELAAKTLNSQRESRHRELEGEAVPSPELSREPD